MLSLSNYIEVSTHEVAMRSEVEEFFSDVIYAIIRRDAEKVEKLFAPIIAYIDDEDSILSFKLGNLPKAFQFSFVTEKMLIEDIHEFRKRFKEFDEIVYKLMK